MPSHPLDAWIAGKIGFPVAELSQEAIQAYQFNRIRQTISFVQKKSSFYRAKLEDVDPGEIVDYGQFSMLPFTYPEDIQAHPQKFVCTGQQEIARIVTLRTSGTTGSSKRIYFTREDQELTIDFFDHGMRNCAGPGDRVMILLPGETPGSVGDLLRIGLERMGARPIPYGVVDDPGDAIAVALKYKVNSMVGIPVQVLSMARHKNGQALAGKLKSILLSTDYVPKSLCQVLEETWGCLVFQHYGMTEMGFGGGVQCSARVGYHLREADLFVEIIDPVTGKPVPDGHTGEIVFTTLTRTGMPLIRYRTGDISRFIPGACPCGTKLKSLDMVQGRISGQVKLDNNYLSLPQIDEALFSIDGIVDYQVTLSQTGEKNVLQIDIKTTGGQALNHEVVRQALQTIPAIREALPGKLEIYISNEFHTNRGTAKRGIILLR